MKDPGLGSKYRPGEKRLVNPDGSFNIHKLGTPSNLRDTYQWLVKLSWSRFLALTFVIIFGLNLLFALAYVAIGVEQLQGNRPGTFWHNLGEAFFFSFQTFTTVGYGHIAPFGKVANFIAVIELYVGLMVMAIITGLLYGRFAKPSLRLLFSKNAVIAPYKNGKALMFRTVNLRKSDLLEVSASVSLTMHAKDHGEEKRKYYRLKLEIDRIEFFPGTWTLVHPIDDNSPLSRINLGNIAEEDLEIIIQLKAFDDTFSQHVHARYSYLGSEILVDHEFAPASYVDEQGNLIIEVQKIHATQPVNK